MSINNNSRFYSLSYKKYHPEIFLEECKYKQQQQQEQQQQKNYKDKELRSDSDNDE